LNTLFSRRAYHYEEQDALPHFANREWGQLDIYGPPAMVELVLRDLGR
jgi:hypothetical protein